MKNNNSNQSYKHEKKFTKQINHMSSFIGMPMWNGRNPTLSEIREYDRRLIERQSQVVKQNKKGLVRFLFEGLKTQSSHVFGLISNAKKKTKNIKYEISKPIKTNAECCE